MQSPYLSSDNLERGMRPANSKLSSYSRGLNLLDDSGSALLPMRVLSHNWYSENEESMNGISCVSDLADLDKSIPSEHSILGQISPGYLNRADRDIVAIFLSGVANAQPG